MNSQMLGMKASPHSCFLVGGSEGDGRQGGRIDAPTTQVYHFTIAAMKNNHKFRG